jgi:hypothetical protein
LFIQQYTMSVKKFSFVQLQVRYNENKHDNYSITGCHRAKVVLGKIVEVSLPLGIKRYGDGTVVSGMIRFRNELVETEATLTEDGKVVLSCSNIKVPIICSNTFVISDELINTTSQRLLTRSQSRSKKTASRTKSSGGTKRRKTQRRGRK